MKLREYNIDEIIADLRILTYTETIDDTPTTVSVELWPSSANSMAVKIFKSLKGELMADDILEEYRGGDWTHTDISDMIKTLHGMAWKQLWLLWVSEYNPLFNVDGKEVRIVETQYGKKTTMEKGTTIETEYVSNDTNEQITNGTNTTQHGLAVTHTEPTVTDKVATFDSAPTVVSSERDATQHSDTNSGTDTVTINNGKMKLTRDGKDTVSYDGTDTDTLSGKDTVTDTFVRGGNIGTTMTTQLLRDGESFWSAFNFFNAYFADIAGDLTLPIYE